MVDREVQKRRVQEQTDLVALIGEQVTLKAKGREFSCLCPFHDDHNPSMSISPTKQIYKCFVCGAGGDVFTFAMQYHKMSFPEALKFLADRAGITLEQGGERSEGPSERQRLTTANQQALAFYRSMLRHDKVGAETRKYVDRRGINAAMQEAFQVGYAPDGWRALTDAVQSNRWDRAAFEQAGLIAQKNGGGHYDRMRHRLIFPICDALGRPIAFGGRKLREEDEPKYLNSPETPLFNKSATLYGLHLAKQAVMATRTIVIVEGYTDVIACHQAGEKNVVATLGTALTKEHTAAVKHFAERVVLIYDGDDAGQKAADRAVEVFLAGTLDVAIAELPDGLDPADLLSKPQGVERWRAAIAAARDALDYQFDRMHRTFNASNTVTGRERVIEEYVRRLAGMGTSGLAPLRRSLVIQRLGEMLSLDTETVSTMLRHAEPRTRAPRSDAATPSQSSAPADHDYDHDEIPYVEYSDLAGEVPPPDLESGMDLPASGAKIKALEAAEAYLIGALLRDPALFHRPIADGRTFDEAVTPSEFWSNSGRTLFRMVYDVLADGQRPSLSDCLAELASQNQPELAGLLTRADADVENVAGDDVDRLTTLFIDSANLILASRRRRAYEVNRRQAIKDVGEPAKPGNGNGALIQELTDYHRTAQKPFRIARR